LSSSFSSVDFLLYMYTIVPRPLAIINQQPWNALELSIAQAHESRVIVLVVCVIAQSVIRVVFV
jgi:hypothetical protein